MTESFVISLFPSWCCEGCSNDDKSWATKEVFGPFSTMEEAQNFLRSRKFGNHDVWIWKENPNVGEMWMNADRNTVAVILPLTQPTTALSQSAK